MPPQAQYIDALSGRPLSGPPPGAGRVDDGTAPAYLVGPAFFDPQVNGYAGVDFQSPDLARDALEHAASELRRAGCAHFLITLITAEARALEAQFARLVGLIAGSPLLRESVLGFHLEGPFISAEPGYRGAHPQPHVRAAESGLFERWQRAAGGLIRIVTVAPECDGASEFVRRASASGVWVSLGHTNAGTEQLRAAVTAGARMFTHLGNATPPQMHRYDNIIHRVLAVPDLLVSLIPDGLHVPPPALGNVLRLLGPERTVMTTDAASPAGAPAGRYRFGALELEVGEDGVVRLPGSENYAGSALTPLAGFYNCVRLGGLSVGAAWLAWTRLRTLLFPELVAPSLLVPFGQV